MHSTLGNMLSLIEQPFQEKVTRNRTRLVNYANRIRQKFYHLYKEYEMEVDVTECFRVQQFMGRSCSPCPSDFFGVTLPLYMNTVEAVWINRTPISLYSKWREAKVGLKGRDDCLVASYDQPGTYCTERDISTFKGAYLQWWITDPIDTGKVVELTYINSGGDTKREAIVLNRETPVSTSDLAIFIKSVVLPSGLRGTIKVKQADSEWELSEYFPHEHVPSYRRIKITGVTCSDQVLIAANRAYHPVFYDTDIVETDNQDAIINAAYHIFYADSGPERGMMEKAQFHLILMKEALKGEASRNLGVNRENDSGRFGPPVKRSRLISGLGGHNINYTRR